MAQAKLGLLYGNGQGVEKNYNEAIRWFSLAAAQGDGDAQIYLGVSYSEGLGVQKDYVRAYMWLASGIARKNGEGMNEAMRTYGRTSLDGITNSMTAVEIEQAKQLAMQCQSSNFKDCE